MNPNLKGHPSKTNCLKSQSATIFIAAAVLVTILTVLPRLPRPAPRPVPGIAPHRLPDPGPAPRSPGYCKPVIASPAPWDKTCVRKPPSLRCNDGRMLMFSQYRQDFYLYTRHFSRLKRRGTYLEVATNNPVYISNTYFMDDCLGWAGLCVEANPAKHAAINAERTCALVPTCVGEKREDVTFLLDGGYSGVSTTNKYVAKWEERGVQKRAINITCTTMAREMARYSVLHVDYLSLDVEGHELNVLKGFDWDQVVVNVMTVESSNDRLPAVREFLESKGYIRHIPKLDEKTETRGKLSQDAVFLHKSVEFGRPE